MAKFCKIWKDNTEDEFNTYGFSYIISPHGGDLGENNRLRRGEFTQSIRNGMTFLSRGSRNKLHLDQRKISVVKQDVSSSFLVCIMILL